MRFWRWVKWASLTVSVGSILLAIVLMWRAGPTEVEQSSVASERPKTEVEKPVIVERKDGAVIWQLRATEAKQQLDGKMHLILPILTLFTQQGREVTIDGQQAWFDPLQRNIHFQDQVNINYDVWRVKTSSLIYDSTADEIHVPEKFNLKGGMISARGKNMRLRRDGNQINVDEGIWIQDKDPQWQGVN